MTQNEITSPVSVLDEKGQAHNFGWSRQPVFSYDPSLLYVPRHRLTESDRYIVFSTTHMIIFEIRDDGWLGNVFISVISLKDKERSTQIYKSVLPLGIFSLPNSSTSGSASWYRKNSRLDFICMDDGVKIIKVDIYRFGHHKSLRGALILTFPDDSESLITNQPWRNNKNAFRYSRCSPWFYAEGMIQFGGSEFIFTHGNAWGILDWNRYLRPKADIRYWACACGHSSGMQLGFCVGYSQADFSQGTENGFFINGKLHKLDQVTFHIPLSDWLSPWRFTSNDNKLEMMFYPHQERIDKRSLFFHNSARRQVCGFFSGKVHLDDGTSVKFMRLTGFAERSKTRF